eukprot:m.10000 g.10000  ORF g.10000 m.10000 type:complete len:315 (+) comp5107_c1_seq1:1303-2247(+)
MNQSKANTPNPQTPNPKLLTQPLQIPLPALQATTAIMRRWCCCCCWGGGEGCLLGETVGPVGRSVMARERKPRGRPGVAVGESLPGDEGEGAEAAESEGADDDAADDPKALLVAGIWWPCAPSSTLKSEPSAPMRALTSPGSTQRVREDGSSVVGMLAVEAARARSGSMRPASERKQRKAEPRIGRCGSHAAWTKRSCSTTVREAEKTRRASSLTPLPSMRTTKATAKAISECMLVMMVMLLKTVMLLKLLLLKLLVGSALSAGTQRGRSLDSIQVGSVQKSVMMCTREGEKECCGELSVRVEMVRKHERCGKN